MWHLARAVTVFILGIVMGVYCCLTVAGICIFLMVSDIEHLSILFVFQFTYLISSLVKSLSRSFAPILNEVCFLTVEF